VASRRRWHEAKMTTKATGAALLAGGLAALGMAVFWGFTVDDALVTARVAHHIALGSGHRFNRGGPVVDAVTPLGWEYLLSLAARFGSGTAFDCARVAGGLAWLFSASWLGLVLYRRKAPLWPLGLLALSAPLGAWACAGMETGVVMALATLAVVTPAPYAIVAASLSSALRPELLPFCSVVALGIAARGRGWPDVFRRLGPVWLLFGLVAVIRQLTFDSPAPLALFAKPSDLHHGFVYAYTGLLHTGVAFLWLGPGWGRLRQESRWLAAAVLSHVVGVILVGGDWMPMYRLLVPVLPAMVLVAADLAAAARTRWRLLSVSAALLANLHLAIGWGLVGRHVVAQRRALIDGARPLLESSRVVGALDIGWVGAATSANLLDLAGITDPAVAYLPGGHTSKRIDRALIASRRVDTLVLLLAPGAKVAVPWWQSRFARTVERRVAWLMRDHGCHLVGLLPLEHTQQSYEVFRCAFESPDEREARLTSLTFGNPWDRLGSN